MEQLLRALQPREACFWSIHGQAELDLLVFHRGRRLGFEFKLADAPQATRSMEIALRDLRLDALTVVYPGEREYVLGPKISVTPLTDIVAAQKPGARIARTSADRARSRQT